MQRAIRWRVAEGAQESPAKFEPGSAVQGNLEVESLTRGRPSRRRHYAAGEATARRAADVVGAALQRRATLSDRIALALRGWDGHFLTAHALQVRPAPRLLPSPSHPTTSRLLSCIQCRACDDSNGGRLNGGLPTATCKRSLLSRPCVLLH